MRTALTIAFLLARTTLVRAEPVNDISVTTAAGHEVRLGAYAVYRTDCSGGTAAELRPHGDQRGGLVVVTPGTLTTTHVPGCSRVTTPANVLFYRPNPGFTGTDRVTFAVVDPATGAEHDHSIVITVTP